MPQFHIVSDAWVDSGIYEAESIGDALDAMARDAGYTDQADASAVAGPFSGVVEEQLADGEWIKHIILEGVTS